MAELDAKGITILLDSLIIMQKSLLVLFSASSSENKYTYLAAFVILNVIVVPLLEILLKSEVLLFLLLFT